MNEVAAETDVSRQTILRSMKELGVPRRPTTCRDCETPTDVAQAYRTNNANETMQSDDEESLNWSDITDQ